MQQLQLPPLAEGEIYAGAIGNKTGNAHHVILLPGDNDRANHQAQIDWAKSIGGDLPNKLEAAMLFAHCKDEFHPVWYWTNETFIDPDEPDESGWAWFQDFYNGGQRSDRKDIELRARAVRRLPI